MTRSQLENSLDLQVPTVLSDGRVCGCGSGGYCAISLPSKEVEDIIGECVSRLHGVRRSFISGGDGGKRPAVVDGTRKPLVLNGNPEKMQSPLTSVREKIE